MTKEDEVRMVAGECLVDLNTAEYALAKCGSARAAIGHLALQADDHYWKRGRDGYA